VNALRRLPWLAVLLITAAALALVAAGCGGDEEEATPPAETAPADTGAAPAEPAPAEEAKKVGMVSDTGGIDDRGFNEFSINALEKAEADFGLETRVYVSNSAEDYLPNLTSAAEDGNQLIVGIGYLLTPDLVTVAEQYPDSKFAGIDNFYGADGCEEAGTCQLPNALGMIFPTEQSGYLAGVLAATMTKSGVVASTAGKSIPPVNNWIAGYQQGIIDTNPDVKILNAYSDDFVDQAKCKEITLDQIAQGADIIYQVAGKCGLGAIDAACEKGAFAIGVDADQGSLGKCVVTSTLKPLETAVYGVIKRLVEGTLETGKNEVFGLKELPDAALLAPYTADVPQEAKDAVEAAAAKVASGEVVPPATLEDVKK
jgi:basic membrane protein A and related proteins